MEWSKVPVISRRGIILGYVIQYTDIVYNITRNLTLENENTLSYNLSGLDAFRHYSIKVAGFTKVGIGPYVGTTAVTDEDGK